MDPAADRAAIPWTLLRAVGDRVEEAKRSARTLWILLEEAVRLPVAVKAVATSAFLVAEGESEESAERAAATAIWIVAAGDSVESAERAEETPRVAVDVPAKVALEESVVEPRKTPSPAKRLDPAAFSAAEPLDVSLEEPESDPAADREASALITCPEPYKRVNNIF